MADSRVAWKADVKVSLMVYSLVPSKVGRWVRNWLF